MKGKGRREICVVWLCLVFFSVLIINGCGDSTPTPANSGYTYAATSSVGDFIQWKVDSSVTPATFNATWNVADSSNNIIKTFTLAGTCGATDAQYNYRKCTVSATSDASSVAVGAIFDVLEAPGVAVFAHPEGRDGRGSGTGTDEIHVGFLLDTNACNNAVSNYAGDYVMTHVAPISNPSETERVGVYRLTSAFLSTMNSGTEGQILHGGFSVAENGGPFRMVYGVGDDQGGNNGTFNGLSSFKLACSGGILNLTGHSGSQGSGGHMTMPGVITSSGLFLFDGPQFFGGIVAAKTSTAATIDDLANKTVIIVWQSGTVGDCSTEGGCTDLLKVRFGAKDSTGKVPATFFSLKGNPIPNMNFRAASDIRAGARFTNVNVGYTNNSGLASAYAQPANIPGLFYSNEITSGQETPTLLNVAKVNGKLLVFGGNSTAGALGRTNCAFSLTDPTNPTGDVTLSGLVCEPESGNFVGFEP